MRIVYAFVFTFVVFLNFIEPSSQSDARSGKQRTVDLNKISYGVYDPSSPRIRTVSLNEISHPVSDSSSSIERTPRLNAISHRLHDPSSGRKRTVDLNHISHHGPGPSSAIEQTTSLKSISHNVPGSSSARKRTVNLNAISLREPDPRTASLNEISHHAPQPSSTRKRTINLNDKSQRELGSSSAIERTTSLNEISHRAPDSKSNRPRIATLQEIYLRAGPRSSSKPAPGNSYSDSSSSDGSPRSSPPASPPPGRLIFVELLGYPLNRLGYVRLVPRTNPERRFEFRRYIFPPEKSILMCLGRPRIYTPIPTREFIVLSTSNGDIFAFMEYSGILRGLYKSSQLNQRLKINMITKKVSKMSQKEIQECQVGRFHPVFPRNFSEEVGDHDSLAIEYH
ncbi:uncharacterized protein LOC117180652 [Belonocnema kinseyi]|uniref:uncharacterized protein LOC117180652 n=1 Tax=Belonocnema kinseyi TaxID=2817044 RepID=UPI00143D10F0|nr:uncharacterized protein LOC117180652 [Belonocnema kinseyi]